MPGTFVYNIDDTSTRKCQCSTAPNTWLGHWERGTKMIRPNKCSAKRCGKATEVGAHVKVEGEDGRTPWIVPFCKHHNKRPSSEPIELKPGVSLCGASMTKDCA